MTYPNDNERDLFIIPDQARTRTSDVILSLMERAEEGDLTLRNLIGRFGDRTFGILMVLLAVFTVIPFISFLSGALIVSLGLQMALGRKVAWLPRFVLDKVLPADKVIYALRLFEPKVRAIEDYVRPRWRFTEAPIIDRSIGVIIFVLGLIILLPLPFANLLPALVLMVLGVGLTERDGLLQFVTCMISLLLMLIMALMLFT